MKSKWHTVRLGDVCQVNLDKRDSSWPHSVISYIDIASVGNGVLNEQPRTVLVAEAPGRAQRLVHAGDTIVSTVRPNRRSFLYVSEPAATTVVSTGFAVLRAGEGLDPRFLYYLVTDQSFTDYLVAHQEGSAYPAVNSSVLGDAEVTIPKLPEQHSIGRILGALDNKIELNRRTNETLEAIARALFKSWFIDFDPVHAKAEGRNLGLPADIAALFPDSFQESDLGEVPKGWDVLTLHDLAYHVTRGISPVYMDAGGVCVLNQKCIRERRVDFSKARRHDSTKKPIEGKALHMLDVLVNSTGVGTLGRVAQLLNLSENVVVDSHVTTVRANPEVDPYYLGIMLTGRESEIEALGEGSTGQTELSRTRLSELPCLAPPRDLRNQFGRMTEPLLTLVAANEQESLTLATLRDALLPKLLSGELWVNGVSQPVGAYQ